MKGKDVEAKKDKKENILVRLPRDVKAWLAEQASINQSSQNSEIVRAVRERMKRTEAQEASA